MEYLRGSFSVGGAPSAKYRDNFDRIFAKPKADPGTKQKRTKTCKNAPKRKG